MITSSSGQSSLDDSDVIIRTANALGVGIADVAAFYSAQWARPICLGRENLLVPGMCEAPENHGKNASVVALMGTQRGWQTKPYYVGNLKGQANAGLDECARLRSDDAGRGMGEFSKEDVIEETQIRDASR